MDTQNQDMLQEIEKDLVGDKVSSSSSFSSGKMGAPLFGWPWQNLGSFKYLLLGTLFIDFMYSKVYEKRQTGHATFLEHLLLCVIIGVPVIGSTIIGHGSIAMFYGYILGFDFLRCMGHSNVEVVPHRIFDTLPILKYVIYTPTYHFIHHKDMKTNFCLFMPLFDVLGKTMNEKSWDLHREIHSNEGSFWEENFLV
ncbi:hypothetical protein M8C21_016314 [Ambrosia artemisiifolia]|uniref:Fatty acid hydroxylase domain-containing protein n=1 Tax=Ambrosia artemisiifolia TaxID=4212 RepID=A0AAD5CSJ8_AMBAR|nr:hypothetical protein M8C21_016314 [Ambrosia artemisiifolia]